MNSKKVKKHFSLPEDLIDKVEKAAHRKYLNTSAFVAEVLGEAVKKQPSCAELAQEIKVLSKKVDTLLSGNA